MLDIAIAIAVSFLPIVCWICTVLGLPGNWGLVVGAAGLAWIWRPNEELSYSIMTIVALAVLALVGEIVEFITGAAGVGKLGGSKRAAVLAVLGSLIGAMVGLFVGLPIPIIGSLIASLLLGGIMACVGAMLGERWAGKEWQDSFDIGVAAFWGRLAGTAGKIVCGFVMLVLFLIATWV